MSPGRRRPGGGPVRAGGRPVRQGGRGTGPAPSRRPEPAPAGSPGGAGLTARGVAIAVLRAAEQGERSNLVLPRLLGASDLDGRDRAFATEVAYGALRMLRACDWLFGQYVRGEVDADLRAVLRAGTYQLAFMRLPAYAAVSATVAECPPRARSVANAVLRRVADVVGSGPVPWPSPAVRMSYPDWLMERLAQDLGPGRAAGALARMNDPAAATLRPDGYTQDLASQWVGEQVAALSGPGGRVLDLCAAPGGKATLVAHNAELVVAGELDPARARIVVANARRLELGNVPVVLSDGLRPPWRTGSFDVVLVDAPCSGLGVLRRRPDARWRVRPDDVDRLARLQRRLLAAAAPLVARGGALVYSVCTLTRAETLDVGAWMLGELLAGWEAVPSPGPPWEGVRHGSLLLPQSEGTDGMYMVAARRPGTPAVGGDVPSVPAQRRLPY